MLDYGQRKQRSQQLNVVIQIIIMGTYPIFLCT